MSASTEVKEPVQTRELSVSSFEETASASGREEKKWQMGNKLAWYMVSHIYALHKGADAIKKEVRGE